jgi:hypothetical protein
MFEEGARSLWDIELRSLLPLLPEKVLEVQVKTDGSKWRIVSSQGGGRNVGQRPSVHLVAETESQERLHATGFMASEVADEELGPIDLASIRARCTPADITS